PGPLAGERAQRAAQLEAALARSQTVDVRTLGGSQVTFGATVVVRDMTGEGERGGGERHVSYQLVGELEADPKQGRLNVTSPLARALLGRAVGERVSVQAPGGEREVEIVEIRWVEP
ncbi:MAG: GreA/GreB family elongation factor, partial [Deltaproteobacteria bacterium]